MDEGKGKEEVMDAYITYLIRIEYDQFGCVSSQRVISYKRGNLPLEVGDFSAQILSRYYVYRSIVIPNMSESIRQFNAYAKARGFIWDCVPIVA